MSDALLVLNAGSSSLKFSVFLDEEPPQLLVHGQLEGLHTQPRFLARNAAGVIGEKEWPPRTELGHRGALDFLFTWGREGSLGANRIVATTMSITALDGLAMGTRCGAMDPGVLLYLIERHGMDGPALERLLYQESGWVIPTNEELMIALHTRRLLEAAGRSSHSMSSNRSNTRISKR